MASRLHSAWAMKALLLTNEYPPSIYGGGGGAGEVLSPGAGRSVQGGGGCFGDQVVDQPRLRVRGYPEPAPVKAPEHLRPVFGAMGRDLAMAATPVDADVVHCHTWYVHLGGILISKAYGIPLVITVHSLEPLRPWKREQLQGGYDLSCWVEHTALGQADAVVAVSRGTREDIVRLIGVPSERVHVIHNGIDTGLYRPVAEQDALLEYGVDPTRPYVLFVGRITRQKGIVHLARAIRWIDASAQVVLAAG